MNCCHSVFLLDASLKRRGPCFGEPVAVIAKDEIQIALGNRRVCVRHNVARHDVR